MSKAKKFGAFAGVFTPSVLTILGVIMYMRLGWVVGEAGLISTLVIIIIAHVISVSTGLSISSVATDKKIKTGGIYYILSRSLGLPMGGSIGIALCIGTALSISLYLVGFAESFLSIDGVRNFLHLEQNVNGYRIIGTLFLILLVVIAFISTSLALKSQYFILGAIALSLISIGIGFFTNSHLSPESVILTPNEGGVSLAVIFGVFFPAVTGFTAGVAMSGDLKDPKKSIPYGTIASVGVGFVVYIVLAIGLAFFVNRDLLINDTNFLLKVAWFSPFVIMGIWGATLSSALGGILGGPRILQAISKDKIVPKLFGKGHGASNEPRNALILIFIIAEAGILVGELNVIAGVVSMFYLASYGFINLAFFLESWASTDFRPSFRVNRYFGLIGFLACFAVMFQLDPLYMFASLIIMLAIYLWLRRKQFKSEFGDVWQSVWLSIVRYALQKMERKDIEQRNWQPNIVLFSGGTNKRTHLIEFGKSLVGKYGMLSNFDLHESEHKQYLFPKHLQSISSEDTAGKGVFTRRQTCSDIYKGIETIVSTYGFSGIEPNVVLMGWARQSSNPVKFAEMIKRMDELDMNLLLIDYEQRIGYGEYKTIDIWWRGAGKHGNLSLTLMKFLWSSYKWRDAKLRLLIENPVNDDSSKIKEKAEQVIDNLRISAEIKIINNQIEKKPFYDIIRTESLNSDLILLGIPKIEKGKEANFVKETNDLMHAIGTVVLVKASSQFKRLNFGVKRNYISTAEADTLNSVITEIEEKQQIDLPENIVTAENIESTYENLKKINTEFYQNYLSKIFRNYERLSDDIQSELNTIFEEKLISQISSAGILKEKEIIKHLDKLIKKVYLKIRKLRDDVLETDKSIFVSGIEYFLNKNAELLTKIPEYQFYSYSKEELSYSNADSKTVKRFKRNKKLKLKLGGKSIKYKVKYKKLINSYLPIETYKILSGTLERFGTMNIQHVSDLQKFIKLFRNTMLEIQKNSESGGLKKAGLITQKELISEQINNIKLLEKESMLSVLNFMQNRTTELMENISNDLKQINVNNLISRTKNKKKNQKELNLKLKQIPSSWFRTQSLIFNAWHFDLKLSEFENKLRRVSKTVKESIIETIHKCALYESESILNFFKSYSEKLKNAPPEKLKLPELQEIHDRESLFLRFKEDLDISFKKLKLLAESFPQKIEIITNEAYNDITENQYNELDTIEISVSALIDYLIQDELNAPLLRIIDELPDKIIKIENNVQNTVRLLSFSFFDSEGNIIDTAINTPDKIRTFVEEQTNKLKKLISGIYSETDLFSRQVDERLNAVSDMLTTYSLINLAGNYKQYISKYGKTKTVSFIRKKLRKVKAFFTNQINRLWYRHSEAVLLKKSLEGGDNAVITKVNRILDLQDSISLDQDLLRSLPFYYQQLFLRTHNYNNEFWLGREKELLTFEKSVKRYNQGYFGALMITGEKFSGKTFFTNYACSKYLSDRKVYTINAPQGGSTDLKVFRIELTKNIQSGGNIDTTFNEIAAGSVVIFDELELWWEKSETGFAVINKIIELIEKFSNKCLFIININIHSFKLINRIKTIDNYFLNIINLKAFNAEQLKNIVLFRHNSGGIPFKLKNKMQENMRQSDFAALFAKHFNYSQGNVGITFFSWIAGIYKFENDILHIKSPRIPDTSVLEKLETDKLIILVQFILHREMSIKKLSRVIMQDEETLLRKINFLKRSGIVTEKSEGIYEINKFMYILIKRKLEEIEMI